MPIPSACAVQIVFLHLRAVSSSQQSQALAAFSFSLQSSDLLYSQMEAEKESNWSLPVISVILRTLRLLSYAADDYRSSQREKARHVVEAHDMLKRFLQKQVVDRSAAAVSKKLGCLFIIVSLFKCFFRLRNLKMCSYLIKMMRTLPPLSAFALSDQTAYQFYYGRLMLFEERYDEAEQALAFAFSHCQPQHLSNKRRILLFLIPVSLLHGRYPLDALLSRYRLSVFSPLIHALRHGDLGRFSAQLELHQEVWIAQGIYLLLEKLKVSVYRNLIRIVYTRVWLQDVEQRGGSEKDRVQLPLHVLQRCVRGLGQEMGMDELECVLANLIYSGQLKGYIAHKRCVVLSKQEPFPKQQTQQLTET